MLGRMTPRLAPLALLLLAAPAVAQAPSPAPAPAPAPLPLSVPQATALKCSAAFALGAAAQARGEGGAWPALGERGREYFVRASARIMDDTGWSRDRVAGRLAEEARALRPPAALAAAMPPCLTLLDAAGL